MSKRVIIVLRIFPICVNVFLVSGTVEFVTMRRAARVQEESEGVSRWTVGQLESLIPGLVV